MVVLPVGLMSWGNSRVFKLDNICANKAFTASEFMMFIILLIILLLSSTESKLAALLSSIKTSHNNDIHGRTNKHKHTSKTLSARLIHVSSPELSFYNPNYTRKDHIKDAVRASIARSYYFSKFKADLPGYYVSAPTHGSGFFMEFTMGTPPVTRYGLFDTGSSFTWFQCHPCFRCYDQGGYPIYYPKRSASYQQVLCDTSQCSIAPGDYCEEIKSTEVCHYHVVYGDATKSRGIVSMDTLTLSSGNTTETMEDMVFGCGNESQDRFGYPGMVGASKHPASLHDQLGFYQFSYFVSATKTGLEGEVHFGPGASLSDTGANTPILPETNEYYHLNITGISVDGTDLDLPPGYFKVDEINGGAIIDSGTLYTILPTTAFEKLRDAIADQMYMYTRVNSTDDDFELCYKEYKGGAPEVIFQFSGLDFALCDSNLWVKDSESDFSCLAILNGFTTIIGMYQQRNVQVGYDLDKYLLTLNPPDNCPDDVIDFIQ